MCHMQRCLRVNVNQNNSCFEALLRGLVRSCLGWQAIWQHAGSRLQGQESSLFKLLCGILYETWRNWQGVGMWGAYEGEGSQDLCHDAIHEKLGETTRCRFHLQLNNLLDVPVNQEGKPVGGLG